MGTPFDLKKSFVQPEFSDVTIKSGATEIRCHKMVLANASDYFRALLSNGTYAESQQGLVELKEDEPEAVTATLLHIYGFSWSDIMSSTTKDGADFYLTIATTAKKYLLPVLEVQAINALSNIQDRAENSHTWDELLALLKVLAKHKEDNAVAGSEYNKLLSTHFRSFWRLQDFRAWLEDPLAKDALNMATEAIQRGLEYGLLSPRTLWECPECKLQYLGGSRSAKVCPRCAECDDLQKGSTCYVDAV